MECESCKYWDKGINEYPCSECVHNSINHYKPMTRE